MSRTAILLVTCCMEQNRSEILSQVVANLQEQVPGDVLASMTVFDNASTEIGTQDALTDCFNHVYVADKNIGYWSAIDWWLEHLAADPPAYTYIIESDVIHYRFDGLTECVDYLDKHPETGSVRTHEYSVRDLHLYNKDRPVNGSKRNIWQSHTNKVTGQGVVLCDTQGGIWSSNFLTHLPALNRYQTMRECFVTLRSWKQFNELDFQRLYWERYQKTGIVDGGLFHIDLNGPFTVGITGSWTSPNVLAKLGYIPTRLASIVPHTEYTVNRLK